MPRFSVWKKRIKLHTKNTAISPRCSYRFYERRLNTGSKNGLLRTRIGAYTQWIYVHNVSAP